MSDFQTRCREKAITAIERASDRLHNSQDWTDPYYAIDGKTIMDDLLDDLANAYAMTDRCTTCGHQLHSIHEWQRGTCSSCWFAKMPSDTKQALDRDRKDQP